MFFRSVFSHIRTEYGEILRVSPYSVQMWKNTDQKNSEHGHFSRSDNFVLFLQLESLNRRLVTLRDSKKSAHLNDTGLFLCLLKTPEIYMFSDIFNSRFHVISMWNTLGVFAGLFLKY